MPVARFGILGPLQVTGESGPLEVPFPQLRRLLCRLLLSPARSVSRSALHETLWPLDGGGGTGPADPAGTLRLYLSRLRRALPAGVGPRADGAGYRLDVEREDVDAGRFETLLAAGAAAAADDPCGAARQIAEALALWRGEALAEFRDEPWAIGPAVRLDELRLVAHERLNDARLASGEHLEAAGELRRLVDEHPLRERFAAQLMLALYRGRRQAEALRVCSRLRARLCDELGIAPSPALLDLEAQILRQDPSLDPGSAAVERAPAVRPRPTHNLPLDATSFVGRAPDIAALGGILPAARLVTLAGPPGAGKTRLALQVARQLLPAFRGGAWLVELAGVADPSRVRSAVAAALGVTLRAGERDDLEVAVGNAQLLVLLDNCEHLTTAVADLCTSLLRSCPDVTVLATSREPLRVEGEHLHRVGPLDLPDPGERDVGAVAAADAVGLFVSRAGSHRPAFRLDESNADAVVALCRSLDGMPLAIEMAAARLRVLSVAQLQERLESRFRLLVRGARARWPHQQTLESLTAWSYDLLTAAEQEILQLLSVFAPGFDIDAAEGYLARLGHAEDVLESLTSLVDKSLLVADTSGPLARYRMLETIRRYGLDRLREARGPDGVTVAQDAHAAFYLERAEASQPPHLSAEQLGWLERTTLDYDNLRGAVAHLTAREGGAREAARLLIAHRHFYAWRGRRPELAAAIEALGERPELAAADLLTARYQLERINQLAQADPVAAQAQLAVLMPVVASLPDRGLEAEVQNRAATLSYMTGEPARGAELRARALSLARQSGHHGALVIVLLGVGATVEEVTEAAERAGDVGDVFAGYYALNFLGALAFEEDKVAARQYFERALELVAGAGLGGFEYLGLNNLGRTLVLLGERDGGRDLLGRGYDGSRRHHDNRAAHFSLFSLAECAVLSGEHALAATLIGACDRHGERTGFVHSDDIEEALSSLRQRVRDKLGRRYDSACGAGRTMSPEAAVDIGAHRTAQSLQLVGSS